MKTRNYGIDFLRMISMIMIVMLHTLGVAAQNFCQILSKKMSKVR